MPRRAGENKVRHLCAFLLKPDIRDFKNALKEPASLTQYGLKRGLHFKGALFASGARPHEPRWLEFPQSGTAEKIRIPLSASSGAVLFIRPSSRTFAFTFGYGRYFLQDDSYEMDFGLKAALNLVDPTRLRSVDTKTFEEFTVRTRRQTSRSSALPSFGVDVSRDILDAVTGECTNKVLGGRITGSYATVISPRIEFAGLSGICDELMNAYKSEHYKEYFGWIDHLKVIKAHDQIERLNGLLIQRLKSRNLDNIHLAPPEIVDWEGIEGFRYSIEEPALPLHQDLEIEEFLDSLAADDRLGDLSTEQLRHHYQVSVKEVELDEPLEKWPVYRCVVCELEDRDTLFVLTDAQWFQVDKSFSREIDDHVSQLTTAQLSLPDARQNEPEGDYNSRVLSGRHDLVLMDRKLVQAAGATSPIEVCDLFSEQNQFIHVKRKKGSSTLSHLFSQGTVSAETFLSDKKFREDFRGKLTGTDSAIARAIPDSRPDPAQFEVVYAIIAKNGSGWPKSLPFFSKLNLRQASHRLQLLGFKVSLLRIGVQ